MDSNRSFRDTVLRIIALIGLLLVLLLGAWGIILLALNLPSIASNVGNSIVSLFNYSGTGTPQGGESLSISAPESVTSGSPFTLSWEHTNVPADAYAYALSYSCETGLTLRAQKQDGTYDTITCATPYTLATPNKQISLIANVTGTQPVSANFTVTSAKAVDGEVTATGTKSVTVNRTTPLNGIPSTGNNTPAPSTPTPTPSTPSTPSQTYVPAQSQPARLYGNPDLAVTMSSVHSLSSHQGRVAVVFEIKNIGTNVAYAGWTLDAVLPYTPSFTYTAVPQQALNPGDKIVYTLTFDRPIYQNPNPQYPYNYNQVPATCYRYDGYQNIPVPCTDADGNIIYTNPNYQGQATIPPQFHQNSKVTVIADPRNYLQESNVVNNTANISIAGY